MRHPIFKPVAGAVVFGVIAALSITGRAQDTTTKLAADCASLKDMAIPASAIGLPTGGAVVQTAAAIKATDEWDPLESTCRHASLSIL